MNSNLESALQKAGVAVKASHPMGTRSGRDSDALISYVDVWRWDIAMYIKSLTVKLHDAETGDLVAIGQWNESPLHAWRDAKLVMENLVGEMFSKLRSSTK
jgi:hypothetical protein